ncbi:MAG TPA: hypothetical protein VGR01_11080 [Burkholderiales bacterium]|jgi:hypothetical protein|nr:hypothetical protein [Burkholderiales bacterium]
MMRALVVFVLAGLSMDALAHDLITAESAQTYLATVAASKKTIASKEPAAKRARAHLDLGKTLDEIRELLNRDLVAHGRVQGLPSNFLMSELRARGVELAFTPETNRFLANVRHYREALKLESSGPVAADAAFRLLQGTFYDSFTSDPLQPGPQTRAQLAEQIALGEKLLKMVPRHGEREETSFILAIHYVQAARSGGDAQERAAFASKARALAGEFLRNYPESMRAATLSRLLERLPAGG